MKDTDYAYASAYVRTLENRLLNAADFEALLQASSYEDAMHYLADKAYAMEFAGTWNEALGACPEGAPVNFLLYQNDFHNLKAVLKALFGGTDYKPLMLEPYSFLPEVFQSAIAAGKPESLPEPFKTPATQAYQILARKTDGQEAEIVLDSALLAALREIALQDEDDFLTGWVDLQTDIAQRKATRRGAVERSSAAAFEKACDNERIRYLRRARYQTFGFAPILSFCMGKWFELRSVRMILAGLRGGVAAEEMRERLRDTYA